MAVISDIHFGHRRNPTERIVRNIMEAFPDNATTAALDLIEIAGDVFDDLLYLNDPDVVHVCACITHLLHLSARYDIQIDIVEGTPLHDRKQSMWFTTLNEHHKIGANVNYYTGLNIVYLPKFDINVLYIQDEYPGGPAKALQAFRDTLKAKGLEKVDLAIMHGQFDFQAPAHFHAPVHDSKAYLELVSELIFIGHDHKHKQLDNRIYVQGSFDRLAQGYETPKGHMRALWQKDGKWDVKFVENVNALRFDTISCLGLTLEETLAKITKHIETLPDESFVRVEADEGNPILTNMETLIRMRPLLDWSKIVRSKVEEEIAPLTDVDTTYIPITITPDNLTELTLERMAGSGASGSAMEIAQELLEELFPWNQPQQQTE